jgi:NADH dehydrogenase FAD-containing subunit
VTYQLTGFGPSDDFFLSYATKINLEDRTVEMRSNDDAKIKSEIKYDRLIIGVGALSNTFNVPGAGTHAFFLKVTRFVMDFNLLLFFSLWNTSESSESY